MAIVLQPDYSNVTILLHAILSCIFWTFLATTHKFPNFAKTQVALVTLNKIKTQNVLRKNCVTNKKG